jgi:predicted nucleic acid-binding protein
VLFDTSMLLPALIAHHPDHVDTAARLEAVHAGRVQLVLCTHAIAELYSTLTSFPVSPRISPSQALQLIQENILAYAEVVSLDARDYAQVTRDLVGRNLAGGVVYDALHVRAAKKADVDRVWTRNLSDFERIWPDHGGMLAD